MNSVDTHTSACALTSLIPAENIAFRVVLDNIYLMTRVCDGEIIYALRAKQVKGDRRTAETPPRPLFRQERRHSHDEWMTIFALASPRYRPTEGENMDTAQTATAPEGACVRHYG